MTMRGHWRRFWRREEGATAVEFGLISTIMLLTLFGIVEIGRIFLCYNALEAALVATGRYYITHNTTSDADLTTYAQARLTEMNVSGTPLTMTVTKSTASNINFIQLDATYTYTPIIGSYMSTFAGLSLHASTRTATP